MGAGPTLIAAELDMPVSIIKDSLGGTMIEAWQTKVAPDAEPICCLCHEYPILST